MKVLRVTPGVGKWFSGNREKYVWHSKDRTTSERKIRELEDETTVAINSKDPETLQRLLVEIHRWKTNGRWTDKYKESLKKCGTSYIHDILEKAPFNEANGLQEVINQLMKVNGCNLPTSTAIASFLYGRQDVPIVDRFTALFFAKQFRVSSVDCVTREVLDYVTTIEFKLDNGGKKLNGDRALRLAYTQNAIKTNLRLYIADFVPECSRIARALNRDKFAYTSIDGTQQTFTTIDVEMAIFAWCMRERDRFDVAYRC